MPTPPTPSSLEPLIHSVRALFPHSTLGPDKWYILLLASIVSGPRPDHAADFYTHLISLPEFSAAPAHRQALIRRLRETLFKLCIVVGVIKPIEALWCIAEIEKPEDRDESFSREHWSAGPANSARGQAWLDAIYKHNHATTLTTLAAHKDFEWLSREITYGLFLSHHDILGPVETQLITLSGIAMQNLPRETAWHLRGTRRIGVTKADVEVIQQCIERVATHYGVVLDRIPRVEDVEHEVECD